MRALDDEDVQAFVSHFLVEDLIEQGEPSLIAGRPLIEAAVQAVLGSAAFEQLYETALRQTHRTLFSDEPIVLQLVDASIAVEVTLASFSPELAESLPSLDGAVVELADSEYVNTALSIARTIRFLAAVLPLLALAAFAASWAVARGRRRALVRIGITVAVVAALTILTLDVGKAALEEFAGGGLRGAAAAGVWDAFLGDLRAWNIALGRGRTGAGRGPPARQPRRGRAADARVATGDRNRSRTPHGSCAPSPPSYWAGSRCSARTTS